MSRYNLKIVDNGRYSSEAILAIQDMNTQKRNWSLDSVKMTSIDRIYTVGCFNTYNPRTDKKRVPNVLRSPIFGKILELIVKDGIRYIDVSINGWSIKFYTRNPEHYKYEYYLEFSKNGPVFILET